QRPGRTLRRLCERARWRREVWRFPRAYRGDSRPHAKADSHRPGSRRLEPVNATSSMKLFPIFADLQGRRVVVVGAGAVAERKIRSLLSAGAQVVAGAPEATPGLIQLSREGGITLRLDSFEPGWLEGAWLVVAATDDRALNRLVAGHANERKLLINVVDDPELSSFQVPSIVDR